MIGISNFEDTVQSWEGKRLVNQESDKALVVVAAVQVRACG